MRINTTKLAAMRERHQRAHLQHRALADLAHSTAGQAARMLAEALCEGETEPAPPEHNRHTGAPAYARARAAFEGRAALRGRSIAELATVPDDDIAAAGFDVQAIREALDADARAARLRAEYATSAESLRATRALLDSLENYAR